MTKNTETAGTFDTRVNELRAQGMRPAEANRIALDEERARNEQTANETFRRDS